MNTLRPRKVERVVGELAEGVSIRSVERMTGVHRDTIMRLGLRVGQSCRRFLNALLIDLPCKLIQIDEVWGFVEKKQKHIKPEDNELRVGDQWTFIALDADTKLVPSFHVGKRDAWNARIFLLDLASRMRGRIQLSSDALVAYPPIVREKFGRAVDYGQVHKVYGIKHKTPQRRYSPSTMIAINRVNVIGQPVERQISTSFVERQNLTIRMHCRRLTRLTNAYSKKLENFKAAVALHFAYYNFCLVHSTIDATPAMAASISSKPWTVRMLLERLKLWERDELGQCHL